MRIWSMLLILLLVGCSGDLTSDTTTGGSGEVPADLQLRSLAASEYRVTFKPSSDWGSGYNAEIEVANLTNQRLNNWKLEFDFAHSITSMWNGKVVSGVNGHYVVQGESYNSWIEPLGSVKFGFQGAPGQLKAPTNFKVTGDNPAGPTSGGTTGATSGATTGSTTGATTGGTTGGTTGATTGGATGATTGSTTGANTGGTTGGTTGATTGATTGSTTGANTGGTTGATTGGTTGATTGSSTGATTGGTTGATTGGTTGATTGSSTGATTGGTTGATTGSTTGATTGGGTGATTGGTTGATTGGGTGGTTGATVTWHTDNDWGGGFVGTIEVKNPGPGTLTDWAVDVQFSGTLTNSWSCKQISRNGNTLRFGPVDYNRSVAAGTSVTFGFQGTPGHIPSLPVTLVGGSTTGGGSTGSTTGGGSTGSTTGGGTTGGTTGDPVVGTGYLHTQGAKIVDEKGATVRFSGVNWFGLETNDHAPNGLWARSLDSMMDQMASEGYNTIRLPFCNQLFDAGIQPATINYNLNPDLVGKTGLQIIDRVVAKAQTLGMKVILDRHRPTGEGQSALWYTSQVSEERWISDFEMLARRYQNNPTVIGFDLHNEPHSPATWGDGNLSTDWRLAAQRCGNRVLAINAKLLIIVEGVDTYGGRSYWWGGNLKGAGAKPVVLSVPNQLVYSTHDYPATVYNQAWFSAPDYPANLPALWDECWGYLVKQNIAPVLVGEFGTRYQTTSDRQWLNAQANYLKTNGISFTYWCWNPNSRDTGGLLQDDWTTIIAEKKAVLAPLLAPLFK